jgi:sulfur-carrier protein
VTDVATHFTVTVRYFAAARAAAGVDGEELTVPTGTTIAGLARRLAARNAELAHVVPRCSYLCDSTAVRNKHLALRPGQTIDLLPPFAGG